MKRVGPKPRPSSRGAPPAWAIDCGRTSPWEKVVLPPSRRQGRHRGRPPDWICQRPLRSPANRGPSGRRVLQGAPALLLEIAESSVALLPDGPEPPACARSATTSTTCGSTGSADNEVGDIFYHRLQSPVLIAELEHDCGVFLDHETPKPCHVHIVLRTPHGNDWGPRLRASPADGNT
ncbi:DUF3500 domain-containing protein [Streptomyces sp. NPDC091215]|uniref:DUF3500 domain-containing protein n=1 Tax=Streptomyces sp. NPDC091215 TaxID=3155192 RepID=UPI003426D140